MTGINQLLCLPKAELNTKNSTKRQLCCRLVEFLVFNSIGQLISLPSDEVYRVCDDGPDHAVVLQLAMIQLPIFLYNFFNQPRLGMSKWLILKNLLR